MQITCCLFGPNASTFIIFLFATVIKNALMLILFCITERESSTPQSGTTAGAVQRNMPTGKVSISTNSCRQKCKRFMLVLR